jgi:ATP-binding protein involved in chromosome partitioning
MHMPDVAEADILNALKSVLDPDLGQDVVSLGFIKNVKSCGGSVSFDMELTTPACPMKEHLKRQATDAVMGVPGVASVNITMTARTRGRAYADADSLKGVKNLIAIASGKGGVGKSTTTVNLALALAASGARVGILDADVYGPCIPALMGCAEPPAMGENGYAEPPVAHGIKLMSVGMLVGPDDATIWRGPIASRVLQQFLGGVAWGELDYLLLDLPPGTGDVQLTIVQAAPLNGAVIVTTPQDVALRIARKGLRMFQKVSVPVLGILENMAGFVCPDCGKVQHIFSQGGGEKTAREMGVPFLGSIPLDPRLVQSGDAGRPLVASEPESPAAVAFRAAARALAAQVSIANAAGAGAVCRPVAMHLHDQEPPQIVWSDDAVTTYEHRALRLACPCAACQDEMTGKRTVREADVPADVKVVQTRPVGMYGQNLVFSDLHAGGIYSHELLRELGKRT